jgi:hypothetical protein
MGLFTTYLFHICTQRLLTKYVEPLLNPSQGLAGVYVGTRRDPDCIELWVSQHLIEGAIYSDASILVCASGPRELVCFIAADSDHFRTWHPIDQGVNMAFALSRMISDVESLMDFESGPTMRPRPATAMLTRLLCIVGKSYFQRKGKGERVGGEKSRPRSWTKSNTTYLRGGLRCTSKSV